MAEVRLKNRPTILVELTDNDLRPLFHMIIGQITEYINYEHRIMSTDDDIDIRMTEVSIYIALYKKKYDHTVSLIWRTKEKDPRDLVLLSDYNIDLMRTESWKTFYSDIAKSLDEHAEYIKSMCCSFGIPYDVEIKLKAGVLE